MQKCCPKKCPSASTTYNCRSDLLLSRAKSHRGPQMAPLGHPCTRCKKYCLVAQIITQNQMSTNYKLVSLAVQPHNDSLWKDGCFLDSWTWIKSVSVERVNGCVFRCLYLSFLPNPEPSVTQRLKRRMECPLIPQKAQTKCCSLDGEQK